LVLAGLGKEDPWKNLKGRLILGEDHFVAKIELFYLFRKVILKYFHTHLI